MDARLPTTEEEVRASYDALNRAMGRGFGLMAIGLFALAIASRLPDTHWGWLAAWLCLVVMGVGANFIGAGAVWIAKDRERALKRLGFSDAAEES